MDLWLWLGLSRHQQTKHATDRLKVRWRLHLEFTIVPMFRMLEGEFPRVQHHPGSRYPVGYTGGAAAIDLVTDDRMPDRLKMRTNLVSPARTRHQHQACSSPSERFLDLIGCAGGLWAQCMNRHACQASRLRADRPVDEACG